MEIAKNYLEEEEVTALKLLVEQYLAFAESQALSQKLMYMKDWIDRLGMILTMNERKFDLILHHEKNTCKPEKQSNFIRVFRSQHHPDYPAKTILVKKGEKE